MKKFSKNLIVATIVFSFVFGFTGTSSVYAAGPAAINLGTAGNFAILSKTGISDANPVLSIITGNIGVSPAAGSTITGLSCTGVTLKTYDVDGTYTGGFNSNVLCLMPGPGANKTLVDNAVLDMGTAYTAASAPATPAGVGATNLNVGSGSLAGQNFVPGVYTWGSNVSITDNITITGTASDVWVFQVSGTLDLATTKSIILAGGALASNIFWQVTGATTLQAGSTFQGTILAQTNIAMLAGATLHGRALAQTAVTLIGNTITNSGAVLLPPPPSGGAVLTGGSSTPPVIPLDTTPPSGTSVSINAGVATTSTLSTNLSFTAMDATQMLISNDAGFAGASWESYATSKPWTLMSGDGVKTVYAKFRDAAGNMSMSVIDGITVSGTGTIVLPSNEPTGGCSGGNLYNVSTGNLCNNNAGSQIPGCGNRTTGFSTATGGSCVGNRSTTGMTYNFGTKTLKNGSRGEAVMELQRFLNQILSLGLVVDGKLGPKTIAVIKKWQKANGLVADGLIGPKTKVKMNASVQ